MLHPANQPPSWCPNIEGGHFLLLGKVCQDLSSSLPPVSENSWSILEERHGCEVAGLRVNSSISIAGPSQIPNKNTSWETLKMSFLQSLESIIRSISSGSKSPSSSEGISILLSKCCKEKWLVLLPASWRLTPTSSEQCQAENHLLGKSPKVSGGIILWGNPSHDECLSWIQGKVGSYTV